MSLLLRLLGAGGGNTVTVTKADLTIAGKAVATNETIAVAKSDIVLAGKAVALNETVLLAKSDITLT